MLKQGTTSMPQSKSYSNRTETVSTVDSAQAAQKRSPFRSMPIPCQRTLTPLFRAIASAGVALVLAGLSSANAQVTRQPPAGGANPPDPSSSNQPAVLRSAVPGDGTLGPRLVAKLVDVLADLLPQSDASRIGQRFSKSPELHGDALTADVFVCTYQFKDAAVGIRDEKHLFWRTNAPEVVLKQQTARTEQILRSLVRVLPTPECPATSASYQDIFAAETPNELVTLGLNDWSLLDALFHGTIGRRGIRRDSPWFVTFTIQYVRACAVMCAPSAHPMQVTTVECAEETHYRNGYGVDVRPPTCSAWRTVGTGRYMDSALYAPLQALHDREGAAVGVGPALDVMRSYNPALALQEVRLGLEANINDAWGLFKFNRPDGAPMRRFEENMRRLAVGLDLLTDPLTSGGTTAQSSAGTSPGRSVPQSGSADASIPINAPRSAAGGSNALASAVAMSVRRALAAIPTRFVDLRGAARTSSGGSLKWDMRDTPTSLFCEITKTPDALNCVSRADGPRETVNAWYEAAVTTVASSLPGVPPDVDTSDDGLPVTRFTRTDGVELVVWLTPVEGTGRYSLNFATNLPAVR